MKVKVGMKVESGRKEGSVGGLYEFGRRGGAEQSRAAFQVSNFQRA